MIASLKDLDRDCVRSESLDFNHVYRILTFGEVVFMSGLSIEH